MRILLAVLMLLAALPVRAQDSVAAFHKGKVVRLIVGIGVGSGYDINARLRRLGLDPTPTSSTPLSNVDFDRLAALPEMSGRSDKRM